MHEGQLSEVGGPRPGSPRLPLAPFLGLVLVVGLGAGCAPSDRLPTPPQPIAYDHAKHLAEGMECTRCHNGAEEGVQAGLPALRLCASCHRRVVPDHPEVQKVLAAWEAQEPILWRRVNSLPSEAMVHFNHRAHARAEIGCETCHGDLTTMTVAEPVINVANMGWCVECHRDNEASDDCLTCHR